MKPFIITFAAFCLIITACHKVDQHYDLVNNQPWVTTSGTTFYVGDTMTMQGKMFLDKGGYIRVDTVSPVFVSKIKVPGPTADSLDQVRFLITKNMGIGKNIPVTVTANGITIQAPAITIHAFSGLLERTDTTLWVDQVASWQPTNPADYQTQSAPLIMGASVDAAGDVYFDNPLGIFAIKGGAAQAVIQGGTQLSDASGSFTIRHILGSAISYDGQTLGFSAEVKDNTDTAGNYVFRFCTMNLNTHTVTTLNRTLEPMAAPAHLAGPGPFEGAAASVNMVALFVSADYNGNWYFTNGYAVPDTLFPMSSWYTNFVVTRFSLEGSQNVLDNVCRLGTDGKLKSLFSYKPPSNLSSNPPLFNAPGYPVADITETLISPDGSTAVVHNKAASDATYSVNVAVYDLNLQVALSSPPAEAQYRFISYDTSLATGAGSTPITIPVYFNFYGNAPHTTFYLPNGNLLWAGSPSVIAYNILNETCFCYAGTEQGLLSGVPAAQDNLTGRAKFVNFAQVGATYFCGMDSRGALYYFTAPGNSYGSAVTSGPLTFYKLYSKP
ncbi:hypothetical protein [Dinghuibacter silviterrae]|uniref:Uncharacterized protein n=1 Tax=Dinghuibacter silviterrae TaxID=1539049 RepID=A0A4R8DI62_9BACT|nr:hypothetical protein [Dinghuibacter silviterrae]TDW96826.1 hypothetical protein EDB95_4662 [Dinghuibacter silviterrae]